MQEIPLSYICGPESSSVVVTKGLLENAENFEFPVSKFLTYLAENGLIGVFFSNIHLAKKLT